MKFTMFSAFLFFLGWMSVVTGIDMPVTCCLKLENTRIQAEYIVKYDIQEYGTTKCALKAARFYTKNDKVICSDPESCYAKRMMKILDGRTTTTTQTPSKEPTKCYTSTTNMIPAVTTANKTPGTQTEASTGTPAPTIVTTVETTRPTIVTTVETTRPTIVTTVETTRPTIVTTVETTRPTIVTKVETTRPKTEISKTTNQPTSVSKENPKSFSTAITCGTSHGTPGIDTSAHLATLTTKDKTVPTSRVINTALPVRTKPSKLTIKRHKKSKKKLRGLQMRNPQG